MFELRNVLLFGFYALLVTAFTGCELIPPATLQPDFSATPASGFAPLSVEFTDLSTEVPGKVFNTWDWDFGDGLGSTEQNPSHTYTDPGTYNVSLTVGNGIRTATVTKDDFVTVDVLPPLTPEVDFYRTDFERTLVLGVAGGVLANDVNMRGSILVVEVSEEVSNGELTLAADGGFTYVPDAGFYGVDRFEYVAVDEFSTTDSVEVLLVVHAPYRLDGMDFGPYTLDFGPGDGIPVTESHVRGLLLAIAPYTKWVRFFGTDNGLEFGPPLAREMGFSIAAGAWIAQDVNANEAQIQDLIAIAQSENADLLIVGSESLLRRDVTEETLVAYIETVRAAVPDVPITTADTYTELINNPQVIAACDILFANIYPFWDAFSLDVAAQVLNCNYEKLLDAADGKPIWISETGWPSFGDPVGEAIPGAANAADYFLNMVSWSRARSVPMFYFEAFNEPWKALSGEGSLGAHWGVFREDAVLKPGNEAVFEDQTSVDNWMIDTSIPELVVTDVPDFGVKPGFLAGKALGVKPHEHVVVTYILVDNTYWLKPSCDPYATEILCDSSWVSNVTTGGIDETATQFQVFLVSRSVDLRGIACSSQMIPQILIDEALDIVIIDRPNPG